MTDDSTLFSPSTPAPPTAPAANAHPYFPGLEILRELSPGVGGMGTVYQARELALQRVVAVKTVRADLHAPALRDLFLREAPAAAQLDHPHILRIHRFSPEHTPPYFVMQYVDGRPLDEACAARDHLFLATILEKVARALAYAHARGIVHRDVKPANILVDRDDEPHIADFGLAARLNDPTHPALSPVGTPVCIAPELYENPAQFSPAVDVYALGVTLYRLLTNRWPFTGQGESLRAAVLEANPPLPQELAPNTPEPLQRICLKAIERDPADRYASALDLAEDLRRFREGREVAARPTRYGRELAGKLRNHLTDLQLWHEQGLLDPREYDRLARPAQHLLDGPYPWHQLSRRFPWETVLLRLGGWLVLLASLLWVTFYWHQLSGPQRVTALAIPTLATTAVGWALWFRRSRVNALLFLSIGALLLPLLTAVVLTEFRWLARWQGDEYELFASFRHAEEPDRAAALAARRFEPSNLELTASIATFVAYATLLLAVTRGWLFALWLGAAAYALHAALLLLAGAKRWVTEDHVSRLLLCFLVVPVLFFLISRLFDRRRAGAGGAAGGHNLAATAYAFFPLPLAACLSLLAYFAATEYLGAQKDPHDQTINLLLMAAGLLYFALSLLMYRSPLSHVRFWGPPLMILVGLHLSTPAHLLFTRGPHLFSIGNQPVTPYELAALLIALTTTTVGTRLRMHALALPGLLALAAFTLRATDRHFKDHLAWPLTVACLGALAMLTAATLLVRRSRRMAQGDVRRTAP